MEEKLTLTKTQLMLLGSGELAYLGDSVYETAIRKELLLRGIRKADKLVNEAQKYVTASSQANILNMIEDDLTEEEQKIISRGKNANLRNTPKNATPKEYAQATALECLFGYLLLKEDSERIEMLIHKIFDKVGS